MMLGCFAMKVCLTTFTVSHNTLLVISGILRLTRNCSCVWAFKCLLACDSSWLIVWIQVADICVEALLADSAKNKVVEAIAEQGQPARSIRTLFASVY